MKKLVDDVAEIDVSGISSFSQFKRLYLRVVQINKRRRINKMKFISDKPKCYIRILRKRLETEMEYFDRLIIEDEEIRRKSDLYEQP